MSEYALDIQEKKNIDADLAWEQYKRDHAKFCEEHDKEMDAKLRAIDPNDQYDDQTDTNPGEVKDQEHFDQWGEQN